jgi:hypothetical protein
MLLVLTTGFGTVRNLMIFVSYLKKPSIGMTKPLLRFISCLIGLSGFGVIVAEVLKKWQLISKNLSPAWVIVPILILFVAKEVTNSPNIKKI